MEEYIIFFYKTTSGKDIIAEFIENLDFQTEAKVKNGINLLKFYGLTLINTPWIKKINRKYLIYELRIKANLTVRLLFFFLKPKTFVVVNIFIKKTNKLPKKEIELAIKRTREFI